MLKNNAMNNKKDTFYFPHEYNAKDDPKCERLIWEMGMEGYGIFWAILEVLRAQPNYTYPLANIPIIAYKYRADADKMRHVVMDFGLFTIVDDKIFFSPGLLNRMQPMDNARNIARESGRKGAAKRWGNKTENRDPIRGAMAPPLTPLIASKVNKSKEEYSIGEYEGGGTMNAESNDVSASMDTGCSAPVPHNSESFLKFQQWITDNAPRVAKMKEPMTDKQLQKLKEEYSTEQICETLQAMHNYEPLIRKNRSAYMTVTNWLRRNRRTTNNTSSHETTRKYNDL